MSIVRLYGEPVLLAHFRDGEAEARELSDLHKVA
jgi:hypothetical protein